MDDDDDDDNNEIEVSPNLLDSHGPKGRSATKIFCYSFGFIAFCFHCKIRNSFNFIISHCTQLQILICYF
jgi:hypothetical protein